VDWPVVRKALLNSMQCLLLCCCLQELHSKCLFLCG
jgi:hypothetical protein